MKPPPFLYADPETLEETLALLADHGDEAVVLAGGQSLMPLLNMRLVRPRVLVDINRVKELRALEIGANGVSIQAGVRQRDVERAAALGQANPLLREAIPLIGHFPIRNRGTICGSMAHADPAAELPAIAITLGAEFVLARVGEQRVLPADEFFVTYLTTSRDSDELLSEVRFPAWKAGAGWAIKEMTRRQGDFALVGAVAYITLESDVVSDVRLVVFGTGGRPERLTSAEDLIRGQGMGDELLHDSVELVRSELRADSDIHASGEYRRYVAGTLIGQVLRESWQRASQ